MARAIDLVLFDFGGVFTESPFFAVEGMAKDLGLDVLQFSELMFGAYHLDTDHPWHKLERGELTFDEAREGIIALGKAAGMAVDPLDLLIRMSGGNLMRDTMLQALRNIKAAGYATGIITNNVREFRDGWRALIPVDELIDKVFDSSELGIRKPDPAIYHLALKEMGNIDPKRAIFLDDVEQNVQSACDVGIHGIRVDDDPAEAIDKLYSFLDISRS